MTANSSIVLTNLDFTELKSSLTTYLKAQDKFRDYNFDGSNMSVLLDILAYNTYHNVFYLNMVASEMFLDTAQLRDSVVSHAKELNYLPRSFTSSQATLKVTVTSTNPNKTSITVPRGTQFSSRIGSDVYTFSTTENVVQTGNSVFVIDTLEVYEGDIITETFAANSLMVLQNPNLDTSSIRVTVLEDGSSTVLEYLRATSLFGLNDESKVFFIQGAADEKYEIVFGDGVIGRPPKDNSVVLVEYRVANGELPNGATTFKPVSSIDGETNISILTVTPANSGTVSEEIDDIKFNAPRHFTTQERAVTTEDYENLLRLNFPEINSVTAYGGELADPPRFGRVFVSVDLDDIDGIPDVKKDQYYNFLKSRCPVSFDPIIIDPEYMYIEVVSTVKYNINTTSLNTEDIRTLVISAVLDYAQLNLNDFNKTLRLSRLTQAIDAADSSIISNETEVRAIIKLTPTLGERLTTTIDFGVAVSALRSSVFIQDGRKVYLQDDGAGSVLLYSQTTGDRLSVPGTIDYKTGLVQFSNLLVSSFIGQSIDISATPVSADISSRRNVVLNIIDADISLDIEKIRE